MSLTVLDRRSMKAKEFKRLEVDRLTELLEKYRVIGVCDLAKVRTVQLQELRSKFRGQILFRVAKNNLMKLAIDRVASKKPGIEKLKEHLEGQNLFIFTDLSAFKVSMLFEQNKVMLPAKVGDVAQSDIIVRKGNTGLPPGPIISDFSDLGIPTKIESGNIMVIRDTVVVRAGETISEKAAGLLGKLGIKPIEAKLKMKAAYEDGIVYPADLLTVDLEAFRRDIEEAVQAAYNLSFNAAIPTPETMPLLLAKAHSEAWNLLLHLELPTPETMPLILAKARREAQALAERLASKDESLKDLVG
ncbi:50S ribosomal protein L10 [Candidatus Bathyarchaeota archaeon]|nr:MAG: 50S ribosomal protein L10 [Candidatus Bathyarchaeota archaeon]